jgi:hypothetical protein
MGGEAVEVGVFVVGADELGVFVTGDAPQPAASSTAVNRLKFMVGVIVISILAQR